MSRVNLYWITNGGFLLLLVIGAATGSASSIHPIYLALLFSICSTPIFNATAFNDRYALLVIFSAVYFNFYGTIDLITLFRGAGDTEGVISRSEVVILLGGMLLQIFYRLGARNPVDSRTEVTLDDWPERTLLIMGLLIWSVATLFTWQFKVNIITGANLAATTRGLGSINAFQTIGYLLANMMQPLGILIIAYLQCRYRQAYQLPLLITVVLVQLVLGFVIDVKGEALIGAVLVVVTCLLVNGKIPRGWIITIATFIALAFPAMQANRVLRGINHMDNTDVAENLMEVIKNTFSNADEATAIGKSQTVFERTSLKGSVEMIVTRTGTDVPFQQGHTLSPMYAAFIPKIIWPDKPDVQTGQLVNKEFKLSVHSYTYISPSHLGEMYWNFGWPGVIVGMSLLGCLIGFIGKKIDMTRGASITQLMIAAITTRQLVLSFESTIAVCYVVWIRSVAVILLLHWLFSRKVPAMETHMEEHETTAAQNQNALPNLMR